jgi:DUF1680 family protein
MSELQKNIWFKRGDTLLLNAFISSTVFWRDKKVKIDQQTDFPDSLTSTLMIEVAEPTEFKIMFKEKAVKAVKINSVRVDLKRENRYIVIQRVFHDREQIEIEIEASLHLIPLQGSERLSAVMFGSVLLAQVGADKPLMGISDRNIHEKFVKLQNERLEFVLDDKQGSQAKFIPLFRVEEEEYSVYLDWTGNASQNSRFSFAADGSKAYEEGER